jgi:hypothetical protein
MMVRGAMHDWLSKIIANFFPIFPIYSRLPPIHKCNSAGNLIWKTSIQGLVDTVVETTDITFDRNGNVIIVGYTIGNVGRSSAG